MAPTHETVVEVRDRSRSTVMILFFGVLVVLAGSWGYSVGGTLRTEVVARTFVILVGGWMCVLAALRLAKPRDPWKVVMVGRSEELVWGRDLSQPDGGVKLENVVRVEVDVESGVAETMVFLLHDGRKVELPGRMMNRSELRSVAGYLRTHCPGVSVVGA